jgi:DNA-binding transcriptional ArsR family regulator
MGAVGTKATKTTGKASQSRRSEVSPGTRLTQVATLFQHLGDPIRLRILALAEEQSSVAEIGAATAQDQSAMSHHLAILRNGGLISLRRQGKQDLSSLTDRGRRVLELVRWLVYLDQPRDEAPVMTSIDPALLEDVGGLVEDPEGWFRTPNLAFEGRRPIKLLGTPDEQRLRDRILAAKLGMFS